MPNNTSRLGLVEPVGTDGVSELRLAIDANAAALDVTTRYFQGTLANRSTIVSSPLAGDEYYATDSGVLYKYDGSAWNAVVIADAWSPLTLASGVNQVGSITPSARLEADVVRLKGILQPESGSFPFTGTLATLPSSTMYPTSSEVSVSATVPLSQSPYFATLVISSTGQISVPAGVPSTGDFVSLNGVTYSLS